MNDKPVKIIQLNLAVLTTFAGLALLGPSTLQALDVSEYGVLKGKRYSQTEATTPADPAFSAFWLSAYARLTAANSITEATVQTPGNAVLPLFAVDDPLLMKLEIPGGLTMADINSALPNGTYLLELATAHDGPKSLSLSITGDSYPNTPTFANFAALAAVDPSAPFTLSWSPFAGGTGEDYIQVRVADGDDVVYMTPVAGAAGALDGASTSAVIPANILSAERQYTARLLFVKVTTRNTTDYPGLTGLGGYYKYTDASLSTSGGGGGTGGGSDTTPPRLVSSSPSPRAVNVSVRMPVVFVFNEPMADAQSIAWSANVSEANFNYDWSGDGLTLTCTYLEAWPEGATISWTLNPSAQPLDFKDEAGNPLSANVYSGSFSTASSSTTNCYEGEDTGWGAGGASKQLTYVQTSAAAPTPHPSRAATFLSSVVSPTNNPVTAATLRLPAGSLLTLTNVLGLGRSFLDTELYDSQSALDNARPGGTYTLQLTRLSGSPSAAMSLAGNYPNTPQIMNYDAAQAINPSADFVLQWNGFAGASGTDNVSLTIVHPSTFWHWGAPDPCVPRALPNTATSITIPAGTLQAGTTYEVTLAYTRFPYRSTNAIPDIQLLTMLQKSVDFTLKTTGGAGGGLRFISWARLPSGEIVLKLQGTIGKSYMLCFSSDLTTWTDVSEHTPAGDGVITVQISTGTYGSPAFFRAREL